MPDVTALPEASAQPVEEDNQAAEVEWQTAYCSASGIAIEACDDAVKERTQECSAWHTRSISGPSPVTPNPEDGDDPDILNLDLTVRCMRFFTKREELGGPAVPVPAEKGGDMLRGEGAMWKDLLCGGQRWPERGDDCARRIIEKLEEGEKFVRKSRKGKKRLHGPFLRMQCALALKIVDKWKDVLVPPEW